MKKVLALVLTLAMLVGTLAVGLSAAFEFTATEDGDVFENVYEVPIGSKVWQPIAYTYMGDDQVPSSGGYTISFDVNFRDASAGFMTANWGSTQYPTITTSTIGVEGAEKFDYAFELGTWYTVKFESDGSSQTIISVNDEPVGTATLPLKNGGMYAGSTEDNFWIDNYHLGDRFEDFEDGNASEIFTSDSSGTVIDSYTVRRDLGKKYGTSAAEAYTFAKVSQDWNWQNADGSFTIDFDISFINGGEGTQSELEPQGNGPWVTNTKIGVGVNVDGQNVDYSFDYDEWYHISYVATAEATEIYVDGVKVEGNFPAMNPDKAESQSMHKEGWYFWPEYIKMDNIKIGSAAVIDFEADNWADSFDGNGFSQAEYVGEKADIWETIQTYPVEGDATLVRDVFNDAKDPATGNYNDFTATFSSGAVGDSYVVDFDLAIYPDIQGNISDETGEDGAWLEFITNAFGNGDDSRVKIGTKFVGKNKDVWYYGQDAVGAPEAVKTMSEWQPGEFHNVAIWLANGSVTVYIDKNEVYSSPVGMNRFDGFDYFYTQNCSVIFDNYRIYDGSTFELKVEGLVTDDDYASTIADVTAEGAAFCEANGHINYWARKEDPKCYDEGTNTYTCWVCGNVTDEKEVARLEHSFLAYDINRVNEEGLVYTECTKSEGCPEKRYIQLPEATDYTGTITYFHDFQDDFITHLNDASWNWTIADGVSSFVEGNDNNYNQIPLEGIRTGAELNEGFKLGFDFIYNGTYETSDTPQYGNTFYLHVGRDVFTGSAMVGYDAVAQQFYISSESSFPEVRSDVYTLVPGETYNFEVEFSMNHDAMEGVMALYINGVKVVELDAMTAYDFLAYDDGAEINMFLMRNFGVAMSIDNYVIGDNDFAWNRQYQGDVDGDYAVTLSDALLMRKYLAKIDGIETLVASRADANGDGVIDARDQLRIRKAIAQAEAEA